MRPSMELMELIDRHGAINAKDAAEMMNLSRAQVGKKGHDLVARGWARVMQDPDDKRLRLFDLTRRGKEILDNGGEYERQYNAVAS